MRTLNLRFAAGLALFLTLFGVGVYFLHRVQSGRIAQDMLWQVQHSRDAGEVDEAIRHAYRYLEFRPTDFDTIVELAGWLEGKAAGRRQLAGVVNQLERALRLQPDRADIRRRVVSLNMKLGQLGECLDHIDRLLQDTPNDAELLAWLGNCRQWTGKHAEAALAYQKSLKADPRRLATYLDYSYLLNRHLRRTDDARRVLDDAVKLNPESADARIALARFLKLTNRPADALVAAKEAVKLAPENVTVLATASEIFQGEGKYRLAREHMQKASDLEPKNGRLVTALAWLMLYEGKGEEAIARLRTALAANPADVDVLTLLGDILALEGRIDALESVVADLEKLRKTAPERGWNVDYMKARLTIRRGEWKSAADLLEKLRQASARSPNYAKQSNYLLATCFEQLRDKDNELAAYRRIFDVDAAAGYFRLEYARALARHGDLDDAIAQFRTALQRPDLPPRTVVDMTGEIADRCRRNGDRSIREFERGFESLKGDDAAFNAVLAKVELLRLRGRLKDALKTANTYLVKRPSHPVMYALKARISEAISGPDAAVAVLAEAEAKVGDDADLRLARMRLIATRTEPGKTTNLFAAAAKLEAFSPEDRTRILTELIAACGTVGDLAAAGQAMEMLRAARPDQLIVRGALLTRALVANDQAMIQTLLSEVAAVEGPDGWTKRCFDVERLLAAASHDPNVANQARTLLADMSKARPGEPFVEYSLGRLDEAEGKPTAKAHYVTALDHGLLDLPIEYQLAHQANVDPAQRSLRVFVEETPLFERMRLDQDRPLLRAVLPLVPASTRASLADRMLKANPDATGPQLVWLSKWLQQQGLSRAADVAMARATKSAPGSDEIWAGRVAQQVARGDAAGLTDLVNEARRTLPPVELAMNFGRSLESAGLVADATKVTIEAHSKQPQNANLRKRLAHLYQVAGRVGDARRELQALVAMPNQPADDLAWARRALAVNLTVGPSLAAYKTSQQLLDANKVDGQLSQDDRRSLAIAHAAQRNRTVDATGTTARQLAIKLLDAIEKQSPTVDDLVLLARLYHAENDAINHRRICDRLKNEHAKHSSALSFLAHQALLTDHPEAADSLIAALQVIDAQSVDTVALAFIRKALTNDAVGAKAIAEQFVAAVQGPARSVRMLRMGHLCNEFLMTYPLGDRPQLAAAIRELGIAMYRPALGRDPQALSNLVRLYARHGQTDLALDLLQTDAVRRSFSVEAVAMGSVIALRTGTPTPQQMVAVERMLTELQRLNPNSTSVMVIRADFLDLAKKHDEAAALYAKVLERDPDNLVARNNLAWILSFDPTKIAEAVRLIEEAIDRNGPVDDLLETRGRILFAANARERGLKDMNEALAGSPSASGFFSLAVLYRQAGKTDLADKALARAKAFGLSPADIHPLDAVAYRELVRN